MAITKVHFNTLGGGGLLVQAVNFETGAVATGTTTIPFDDTIPQNTEGTEFMTLAITPTDAGNKLIITVVTQLTNSVGIVALTSCLFQDSIANALACMVTTTPVANSPTYLGFKHEMTAGTTSSITFKIRSGPNVANTVTFNGQVAGRIYGGVIASSIRIEEIAA